MKILHISPFISPVRGGPSHAVVAIVRALRDARVDAEIATTNDDGAGFLKVPLGQRSFYQHVPVWFFPRMRFPLPALQEFIVSIAFTRWLWQHITDYDLIHIHLLFSYPCTMAMAIARFKGVPYVVRPNGLLCTWSLQQKSLKKQIYLALIERSNLNHSTAIEFTAREEQQQADSLQLKSPGFVLPYGVERPTLMPAARVQIGEWLDIPPDDPVILFLARLHPKKGLDYLIPALSKNADRPFTVVIAGSGDPQYEAEIDELVKVAGIADRTRRVGFVEGEQKQLLLQGADIFVLPSHSESFGLAVLEAIAHGLLVVTTPHVPLATLVHTHHLGHITNLDVWDIAIALQQSLKDLHPAATQARRDRTQLILEQFSWSSIAENLIGVYNTLLTSGSPPDERGNR